MFSETLKDLRLHKRKMTQRELAEKLGVSQQAVAKWETDKNMPDNLVLVEIARIFGVTIDYLMGQDSSSKNSGYYHDPEVAEIANEMKENPNIRVLFDATRGLKKESIEEVRRFIEYQKARERGDYDWE